MKTYKSKTQNGGKTVILESVQLAIDLGFFGLEIIKQKYNLDNSVAEKLSYNKDNLANITERYKDSIVEIQKGNPKFKKLVNEEIDSILDLIDAITPSFSLNRS